jgi:L-aspartate oxidase
MGRYHPLRDLAPRDIVARAIVEEMRADGSDHVYLDCRDLKSIDLAARFPGISAHLSGLNLDLRSDPIPVSPAAHYLMGGIRTDIHGRTTLPGLYACGECACTGVHGANRLASNSLMETVVFGKRVVEHMAEGGGGAAPAHPGAIPVVEPRGIAPSHEAVQRLMWDCAGIVRDAAGMSFAIEEVRGWPAGAEPVTRSTGERRALTVLSSLLLTAALKREESRGAHYRSDFPEPNNRWKHQQVFVREP